MNVSFKNVSPGTAIALAVGFVVFSIVFAGCSPKGNGGTEGNPPTVSNGSPTQPDGSTNNASVKIAVYIPMGDATDTKDVVIHPVSGATADSPAKSAMTALVADTESGIPIGTHLLSIKLKDSLATVDFSQIPVDLNHGEGNQAKALNAILMTLGQFDSISSVQILVNGNVVKDGPQFSMDVPIDVIRPGQDQQAQAPGGQAPG